MRYCVDFLPDGRILEELSFDGVLYKRETFRNSIGTFECNDEDFAQQLEDDGVNDEDLLDEVYDALDGFWQTSLANALERL